jgi:hypothetical protein
MSFCCKGMERMLEAMREPGIGALLDFVWVKQSPA